jgi:hypothetical protein
MDIEFRIRDEEDHVDEADTPEDLSVSEFLRRFIPATGRRFVETNGKPIIWVLFDESTGRSLDVEKSFRENGIRSRHRLVLRKVAPLAVDTLPRPDPVPTIAIVQWVCPKCGVKNSELNAFCGSCGTRRPGPKIEIVIQDAKDRLVKKRVLPGAVTQDILREVLQELDLPANARWEIDDKDIRKKLAAHKTLEQNGVLDGHHLFLYAVEAQRLSPWEKILLGALILAIATCGSYILYKLLHWPTLPPVPITITISPTAVSLKAGESAQFTADVKGANNGGATWSTDPVDPIRFGSVTQQGMYQAPATISETQVAVVATSIADNTKHARVTVNLVPDTHEVVSVSIREPKTTQLSQGEQERFSAEVAGGVSPSVRWSIEPDNLGSISSDGIYYAPASIPRTETVTVVATSIADLATSARFAITLVPTAATSLTLTVEPSSATLKENQTQQFKATGQPANRHLKIRWSITPPLGHISQDGLYTAPDGITQSPPTVLVRAVPNGNQAHTATATITLQPKPSPFCGELKFTDSGPIVLHSGETHAFHVTGADEDAVRWSILGPGSIEHGLYTAPSTILPASARVFVKARCRSSQEVEMVVNLVP